MHIHLLLCAECPPPILRTFCRHYIKKPFIYYYVQCTPPNSQNLSPALHKRPKQVNKLSKCSSIPQISLAKISGAPSHYISAGRQQYTRLLYRYLKVRLGQNVFMKSSIFQKMNRKISALCTLIKTLRADILQIFWFNFWKLMISQIHSDLI